MSDNPLIDLDGWLHYQVAMPAAQAVRRALNVAPGVVTRRLFEASLALVLASQAMISWDLHLSGEFPIGWWNAIMLPFLVYILFRYRLLSRHGTVLDKKIEDSLSVERIGWLIFNTYDFLVTVWYLAWHDAGGPWGVTGYSVNLVSDITLTMALYAWACALPPPAQPSTVAATA